MTEIKNDFDTLKNVKGHQIHVNSNDKINPIKQIEIVPSERGEPIVSGSMTPFISFPEGGLNQDMISISLPYMERQHQIEDKLTFRSLKSVIVEDYGQQ